jgi:ribosome maturation factor RimP
MSGAIDQIQQVLEPILESMGLTLWELEFHKQGPKWLLRVYIEREAGGVTLSDCEAVSRDLSVALDVEDFIQHAYTLEVSSPGLDRTLTKPEHFSRFVGSTVKIKTYEPLNGQKVFRGKLLGMFDDKIKVVLDADARLEISVNNIAKVSLEVDF